MLLYEVDGNMLTSQDVFRLYGNGSSSEDEQKNSEPLFTSRPKTVITYLSETESSSDSDLSSLTSSESDTNSEDKAEFRKAQVNGKQPNKPLRSALKKARTIPQRKDSLHSTEEVGSIARRRLDPKQLRFHGRGSTGGLTPDVCSPASRSVPTSASPPSILRRTRGIQIIGARPADARSPGDSSRPSTGNTHCINNIQSDLDGVFQHLKNTFPSPGLTPGVQDIGVQTKLKVATESNAMAIDKSELTSPAMRDSCDERLTFEQAEGYKSADESRLMEYESPSSVGAVRHVCDNTRIIRSFRKSGSQSRRSSIRTLSSITNHSLNQPQAEAAFSDIADKQDHIQSSTLQAQIPDLEDPVNPNQVHLSNVKEITDDVAALQTHDANEGYSVPRNSDQLEEVLTNTQAYSLKEFIGEKQVSSFTPDVVIQSFGEKDQPNLHASVELKGNLWDDSFVTESTAKAEGDDEATGSTEMYETSPTVAQNARSASKNRMLRNSRERSASDVVNFNPKLSTSRRRVEKSGQKQGRSKNRARNKRRKTGKNSEDRQEIHAQESPIQQYEMRKGSSIEQPNKGKRRGRSKAKNVQKKTISDNERRRRRRSQDSHYETENTDNDERKIANPEERLVRKNSTQQHESQIRFAKRLALTDSDKLQVRRSENRKTRTPAHQDKRKRADISQERDARRDTTPQNECETGSGSNIKHREESSNKYSVFSAEIGQNFDMPPPTSSPSGMNQPEQELPSSNLKPPTLADVGNYDSRDGYVMGLSDDDDANDMKQSEIRPTKETSKPDESILTASTAQRNNDKRNSELQVRGSLFRSSICEVGARVLEQERQEEKIRQEKGLQKGPRRSKRQRLKPQFFKRAVLEFDQLTGFHSYKKDEEGNVIFENVHCRSQPKRNLKRKRRRTRVKKKRRRLQAEREEMDERDNEDDSDNRKVDLDEVIPAKQYVWAYSEENPEKEHKLRLTEEFHNVVFKVMDPETGLKGGKALEIGKYATGFLEIPPGQGTRPEISAQTEIYIPLKAPRKSLKFKMGENAWHLSANDVFVVPKNNHYYLENLHLKSSVLLAFIIVKNSNDVRGKKQKKERASRRKKKKGKSKSKSSSRIRSGEPSEEVSSN